MSAAIRSSPEAGETSFWPSPRKMMERYGSVERSGCILSSVRNAKKRIPVEDDWFLTIRRAILTISVRGQNAKIGYDIPSLRSLHDRGRWGLGRSKPNSSA